MISKNEWLKSLTVALILLIFCCSLPDMVRWFKTWELFTLLGILEVVATVIILIALAIFVKARYDKADNEFEQRKRKLKSDLKDRGKWK